MLHINSIEPLPGYRLELKFTNGAAGQIDLHSELWGEMFQPLLDDKLFMTARLDPVMRTVVWENGADFAPEFLLDLLTKQMGKAA
jgi:hypothetical protein